ncbi:glycosyl hydrolase 53 family protein [bacterium]|nr:glycosyl hydrolase 53 family protein [bacterium]
MRRSISRHSHSSVPFLPAAVALAVVVLLASGSLDAMGAAVMLRVDMRIESSFGRFDPDVDTVVVRGSFNGWSGSLDVLNDGDGDGIYELILDLAPGAYPYKFVIPLASRDRWEHSIADRIVVVGAVPVEVAPVFFDHRAGWIPGTVQIGADLSFTPELISLGAEYRVGGVPVDLLEACVDHGFGIVRLRLWHTPAEPWHGLDATVTFAQGVKAHGLALMLDIHYSDSWADPGQQTKPAAWEGLAFEALVDSVYAYTNAVVRRFRDEGALPDYVQIGNEISPGMLWDDGRIGWQGSEWDTPEQWDSLEALLRAGIEGVRDSLAPGEETAIIIHYADGGNNEGCRWFYDNLVAHGVPFDIIGLSFCPWWHGTIWDLRDNLDDLALTYGRELMIVETGYPWTLDWYDDTHNFVGDSTQLHVNYPATPDGQFEFLRDVVAVVEAAPGDLGTGVLYWEPGYLAVDGGPGNPYENITLFDFDGDALRGFGFGLPWNTDVSTGEEHGSRPVLSPGAPNPFCRESSFTVTVPEPGARVNVRVCDAAGRLVATVVDGSIPPGARRFVWDGQDDEGRRVASGVYFLEAVVAGERAAGKLIHLR